MEKRYDIILVSMPYTFTSPSLALGLLKAELAEAHISCLTLYSAFRYISFLRREGFDDAERLMRRLNMGWEILFSKAAGFSPALSVEKLLDCTARELINETAVRGIAPDYSIDALRKIWSDLSFASEKFLEREADFILSKNPKIVGCALLTQQRNASFALLRKIKQKSPDAVTMIGGGCCAGEAGAEYLRLVPSLDYVFSGEADGAFANVCRLLMNGDTKKIRESHPELLTRGSKTFIRSTDSIEQCPVPDYSDYFEQMKDVDLRSLYFITEGSRGCWWGEKYPNKTGGRCRFCGLEFFEEARRYRTKSPRRIAEELARQSKRYKCDAAFFSDSVLSGDFIKSLPEKGDENLKNLYLMAECRTNLSFAELKKLKANGFHNLQPGLESLSDEILALMNKGAKTIDHLAFLKNARILGIRATWNILHTLPGERREWYEEMLLLMRQIHHLEPPTSVNQTLLARNSVFAEEAEKYGISPLLPLMCDLAMNPDDKDFTRKTAHFYASPHLAADRETVARLHSEVAEWRRDFLAGVHLVRVKAEGFTAVRDARDLSNVKIYRFTGAIKAVFDAIDNLTAEPALRRNLQERFDGDAVTKALDELEKSMLVYRKDDRLLSLATPKDCAQYHRPIWEKRGDRK